MAKLFNRVRMTVSGTPGTGAVTLGAAYSNAYCTFAEAGVANSDVVSYFIEDGNDFEIGIGTYTSSGTTLSRDTVRLSKISGASGTTKLTLTSSAIVYLSPSKEEMGTVLQCVQNTYATNTALSTTIPDDDTVPTSSEGTQVLSQAITLSSNTSKVLALVNVWGGTGGSPLAASLFRGSTIINAAAVTSDTSGSLSFEQPISMSLLDSPATAGSVTYSVRVGAGSGNARLNGDQAGRKYGGASLCTLTLLEIRQ